MLQEYTTLKSLGRRPCQPVFPNIKEPVDDDVSIVFYPKSYNHIDIKVFFSLKGWWFDEWEGLIKYVYINICKGLLQRLSKTS